MPNKINIVQGSDTTKLPQRSTAGNIKIIFAQQHAIKLLPVLFLFLSICSFAQVPLQLDDAINIALKNSYDIQVSRNNLEINSINNTYGVAGGLPLVTGSLTDNEQLSNVNQQLNTGTHIQRNNARANGLTSGVAGSILLFNGMRVVATKQRLDELEKQDQQYVNSTIENTIAAVMTQYYDVVRQQSYMRTLDTSIAIEQKQLNIVQTQLNVGLANNADLFQTQLDLNALIQAKQSQQLIIEQAKTTLLTTLTLKPDSAIIIADTILVDSTVMLEDVVNNIGNSPEVVAAGMQVTINQLLEKETAAQRYPSVYANAGYNYNRSQTAAGNVLLNQNYGPYIGLSLTVPIYNGGIYKRQQQEAAITTRNSQLQQNIVVRDNTSNAVKNYEAYQNALQQLQTQRETYALAKQLLDLVLLKFQLRVATITDVKNAETSFENAGYLLVNLSYSAKAAEIEMKRLTNKLSF